MREINIIDKIPVTATIDKEMSFMDLILEYGGKFKAIIFNNPLGGGYMGGVAYIKSVYMGNNDGDITLNIVGVNDEIIPVVYKEDSVVSILESGSVKAAVIYNHMEANYYCRLGRILLEY